MSEDGASTKTIREIFIDYIVETLNNSEYDDKPDHIFTRENIEHLNDVEIEELQHNLHDFEVTNHMYVELLETINTLIPKVIPKGSKPYKPAPKKSSKSSSNLLKKYPDAKSYHDSREPHAKDRKKALWKAKLQQEIDAFNKLHPVKPPGTFGGNKRKTKKMKKSKRKSKKNNRK